MPDMNDRQQFRNEDLVLAVSRAVDQNIWDEGRYEAYLDELCGFREYQKDAIRMALRYLLGGQFQDLRALAKANFDQNLLLQERYGSWATIQRHLQLPDQLSASIDLATGTGKSYVLYGIAAILLAEGVVDQVLVLCPSTTIELGLLEKFRALATNSDLRDLLPSQAKVASPSIINGSQSIVAGCICVENYHAILAHVGSSIRDSLLGKGTRTLVLNDEAHHVANDSRTNIGRWKEFLLSPEFGFRYVLGVSGTCYVGNDYFADVIYRYSLRQAIEERYVKTVTYVADMPSTANPNEKWQLVRNRHEDTRRKLRPRGIKPLTIIVTNSINNCQDITEELKAFLREDANLAPEVADEQVLAVYNNAADVPKLPYVDNPNSSVEWIVSVSMLNEGWDVKRVFQIVPHEERAFNSKLLISQVLGRGLRVPEGWTGEQPEVIVFNHARWAPRIRHLMDEILEIEKRLSVRVQDDSPYHFELHNIEYSIQTSTVEKRMDRDYQLFTKGYIDLASEAINEDVSVEFVRAATGDVFRWQTEIQHKTFTPRQIAQIMYERLEEADNPDDPSEGEVATRYTETWSVDRLEEVVRASLARLDMTVATDRMRQKFLQSMGTLRRRSSQNVRYTPTVKEYITLSTRERQMDSVSSAELRTSKTYFYTEQTRDALIEEQVELFDEVTEPGRGLFKTVPIANPFHFKTPLTAAIADSENERRFMYLLTRPDTVGHYSAWIKSTSMRFYEIDFAWKKGNTPKRGKFNPDFFIKIGDLMLVIEVKGDEELTEPSEENRKKNEYALEHFERVNKYLQDSGNPLRYHFHFLTPHSFNTFFQELKTGRIASYRSDLDVRLVEEDY